MSTSPVTGLPLAVPQLAATDGSWRSNTYPKAPLELLVRPERCRAELRGSPVVLPPVLESAQPDKDLGDPTSAYIFEISLGTFPRLGIAVEGR